MIRYLLVDSQASAAEFAEAKGWEAIGFAKYLTPAGDYVIAATRPTDLFPSRAQLEFIRAPNFAENPFAGDFESMLKAGTARLVKAQ
jgi:hypothetical protein